MIIGPQRSLEQPHRLKSEGLAPGKEPPSAPGDVIDVTYHDSPLEIARESGRMGARALLRLGLPALGAALAGPLGLLGGLGVSSAIQYFGDSSPQKTRNALLVGGISAGLGALALVLGPAAGVTMAGLATGVVAFAAGRKQGLQEPTVSLQPQAFAQRYLEKVKGESPTSLQGATTQQCADAVLRTFQWACTNLPAGAALTLAGESAGELMTSQDLARFDQALLRVVEQQGKVHPGRRPLQGSEGLIQVDAKGPSPAFAANQVVFIDKKFESKTDPVTRDLVLGHELSHVRHRDAAFKQGVKTLNEMLTLGAGPGNLALDMVKLILQSMMAEESRKMELRADQDGKKYALQQGHSVQAVMEAAGKLFAQAPTSSGLFDSHPPGPERLKALQEPTA